MSDRSSRSASATIRTHHERPGLVAAALRPDNTDEMTTRVERDDDGDGSAPDDPGTPGAVVTRIERDDTAGVRTTADDYVSNLRVAQRVLTDGDADTDTRETDDTDDTQPETQT